MNKMLTSLRPILVVFVDDKLEEGEGMKVRASATFVFARKTEDFMLGRCRRGRCRMRVSRSRSGTTGRSLCTGLSVDVVQVL